MQTFSVSVVGVTYSNEDGTSRQELLSRCQRGEGVLLRREPHNPHNRWAVAVHKETGEQIGYVPAGDRRLAEHIERGGEISARIIKRYGGPGLLGRPNGSKGKPYGCVIEIVKGDFDWKAVEPYMTLNRAADQLVKEARQQERDTPDKALELYLEAINKIEELDALGEFAQAWRTTRYPINRLSLLLERLGQTERALRHIEEYLVKDDRMVLSSTDKKAVSKRRDRLNRRMGRARILRGGILRVK